MVRSGWVVGQLGRRESYNVPKIIGNFSDVLSFNTNHWCRGGLLKKLHPSFALYYDKNLKTVNVKESLFFNKLFAKKQIANKFDDWVEEGEKFSSWVVSKNSSFPSWEGVFGYTCANLELLKEARNRGALAVHGQIDPGLEWYDINKEEYDSWGLQLPVNMQPTEAFLSRIQCEWDLAERIIVNSEYSKSSLVKHGVCEKKIHVVPLVYNDSFIGKVRCIDPKKKFRVLFIGNINLTKGFQYFSNAYNELPSERFEFFAVGTNQLSDPFLNKINNKVNLLGHLPPHKLKDFMKSCHALVFPTLSEGFGMVQLEAMGMGLPVIATSNCGEVVQDKINGYVVPIRDSKFIADRLLELSSCNVNYMKLSSAALNRVKDYSFQNASNFFNKACK